MAAPKDGHDGRLGYACLKGALGLHHAHLTGALRRKCLADWFAAGLEHAQHDVGMGSARCLAQTKRFMRRKGPALQISGPLRMLEQVLYDVLCRGTAAEQRVCLASTVAIDLAVPAARTNASSVEASDGLISIVDDLGVGIDANAARGVQHA